MRQHPCQPRDVHTTAGFGGLLAGLSREAWFMLAVLRHQAAEQYSYNPTLELI